MKHKILLLTALLAFVTIMDINAQDMNVDGVLKVSDGSLLYSGNEFNATSTSDISIEGHFVINDSVSGTEHIVLESFAHLELKGTAQYPFRNEKVETIAQFTMGDDSWGVVGADSALYVTGDFGNTSTAVFRLLSNADGYAQLKIDGNYTGTGEVLMQQFVSGEGWHNVSVPFSGVEAGVFGDVGTNRAPQAKNMYYWDDGVDYTWNNVDDNTHTLSNGRGYSAFYGGIGGVQIANPDSEWTIEIDGVPITSVTPSLGNSVSSATTWEGFRDSDQKDGWNLVANPFTAALDFDALAPNSDINNSFYTWNPSTSLYSYWSAAGVPATGQGLGIDLGSYIAPMQSFWVQTTAATSLSLDMADHTTVAESPVFLRPSFDRLVLHVTSNNTPSLTDHSVAAMIEGTTDGFDGAWDAHKFMNAGNNPNIYSTYGQQSIATNAINYGPSFSDKKTVPISFRAQQHASDFTISFNDEYMLNTYAVYLEDKLEQTFTDLNAQDYSFMNDTSMIDRFVLHFRAGVLSIDEPEASSYNSGIRAWVFDGVAQLRPSITGDANLSLVDLSGKVLQTEVVRINDGEPTEWPFRQNIASGVYFLNVQSSLGIETIKFTHQTK